MRFPHRQAGPWRHLIGLAVTSHNATALNTATFTHVITLTGDPGFHAWMANYSPEPADPLADPDHDGMSNLMEYVLDGHPLSAGPSIFPALESTTDSVAFSFLRRAESAADTIQVFEYSTDLGFWHKIPITAGPSPDFSLGPIINGRQIVTVQIPAEHATSHRLFGRLSAKVP